MVSTDYVPALLEQSQQRAAAEGLVIDYREADAEELPFSDGAFDNVVSTFGVMFTPNQAQAASELLRVCKAGGRIGLTNWTPESFIGELFKVIGRHRPPPVGVQSPPAWGTEAFLNSQFSGASSVTANRRAFTFRYLSPEHWLDVFRTYYGPTLKTYEALDGSAGAALSEDIIRLIDKHNRATDGPMVVPSEYLEVVIVR